MGIEPTTRCLEGNRSTAELPPHHHNSEMLMLSAPSRKGSCAAVRPISYRQPDATSTGGTKFSEKNTTLRSVSDGR